MKTLLQTDEKVRKGLFNFDFIRIVGKDIMYFMRKGKVICHRFK